MTRTIGHRIRENATRTFVGREAELLALRGAIDHPDRVAALVHGPGGIGKSRLLGAALAALPADTAVTILDGRDVEPTPRGVHAALGRSLGLAVELAGPAGAAAVAPETVHALAAAPRHVLAVDTYEVLGLIDAWLRNILLPSLPASVFTVLVGRDRPAGAWHTAPGWAGRRSSCASGRSRRRMPTSCCERADSTRFRRAAPTTSPAATRWRSSSPPRGHGRTPGRPRHR